MRKAYTLAIGCCMCSSSGQSRLCQSYCANWFSCEHAEPKWLCVTDQLL